MATIGNLICLTPRDSYVVDEPVRKKGLLGRLEQRTGAFLRSPGIGFPYLVGFFRKNGILTDSTRVVVQHDKIEGPTPFEEILTDKVDLKRGDHDVLFLTAYTNSAREAYRRAREARAVYAAAGKKLTIVFGGAHASAIPAEGTGRGYIDSTVVGEGEWAASALLNDIKAGKPVNPVYRASFDRIRDRGTLALDMGIWRGLKKRPQQLLASTHLARGCKLDCHFCAVFLTNGSTVRNRDLDDVVEEIESQVTEITGETIDQIGPGFYNGLLRAFFKLPIAGSRFADRLVTKLGPGFSDHIFFWDDNLYNAPGSLKALCEAIGPLRRPWAAEMTMDVADKPELLKLAYDSGCRNLFLGIESVSQTAIDGLEKWSNDANSMRESVKRVHDAGISVMGAFVFGLDGDDSSCFDQTLEFIYRTGIDFVVANIIQPYPGTGTFRDAIASNSLLPSTNCPPDSDVAMDYNWPLFDGAHVLIQPKGMTERQLQEGYYSFLREAYSLRGILRRSRAGALDVRGGISHFVRNYLASRYGMAKVVHAIRRKGSGPVGHPGIAAAPGQPTKAAVASVSPEPEAG